MMTDMNYQSNSYKSRENKETEEKKEVRKVISGKAKTRKKNEIAKFAETFIAEDVASVKAYIKEDIIIPTIRDTLWSIFTNSLDMFLYGKNSKHKTSSRNGSPYVSYSSISDRNRRDDRSYSRQATQRFSYDEIEFESRGDAERVLDELEYMIKRYGMVTVADMYDMAEMTAPYTSNRYGWTSIRNANIVRTREGSHIIKMPAAMPLDY